ncbi:hypothetical protein XM38_044750 [Halomicronema hongdechloris C2206]|uniref:Uncharacterized protein n=1 Tax=Halomicronema hongdechloris C2206 TaxID=1641165 RepID=A0A1Z3HT71_9CYAN|nr:hypothetical protein [Halomicronema hongdechloris]ASC73508.1 hypothetical protein XM38_044750 [Halomicronema hongdechloris C2206]
MPSDSSQSSESREHPLAMAARNFLIGVFLSGVPILAYLWLSVDMTYGSWAAVGTGRLVGAIAIPLLFGLLSASFGQRVIRLLTQMLESVNLPF